MYDVDVVQNVSFDSVDLSAQLNAQGSLRVRLLLTQFPYLCSQ